MQKYDEIKKITDSQNPEFDLIWEAEALMRRNLFIVTAEEAGLRRYEKLLGITPLPHEDFEARRNHILVRWNQKPPYTFRFLIGLLETMTDGKFEVITDFNNYAMKIKVFIALDNSLLGDIAYVLRHIIPANIATTINSTIDIYINNKIFTAGAKFVYSFTKLPIISGEPPDGYLLVGNESENGFVQVNNENVPMKVQILKGMMT